MINLPYIPFNIWDDFWDDECVPQGEIQETHGYVEEYDVLDDTQKAAVANLIYRRLQVMNLPGVEMSLLDDEITFKHLTHVRLERLIEELNAAELSYEGVSIRVYSES